MKFSIIFVLAAIFSSSAYATSLAGDVQISPQRSSASVDGTSYGTDPALYPICACFNGGNCDALKAAVSSNNGDGFVNEHSRRRDREARID